MHGACALLICLSIFNISYKLLVNGTEDRFVGVTYIELLRGYQSVSLPIYASTITDTSQECVLKCHINFTCLSVNFDHLERNCSLFNAIDNSPVRISNQASFYGTCPNRYQVLADGINTDCEVSEWSSWSACGSCMQNCTCTKTRSRIIDAGQSGNGAVCPEIDQSQSCINGTCALEALCNSVSGFLYPLTGHCYKTVASVEGREWDAAYNSCREIAIEGTWGRLAHVIDQTLYDTMDIDTYAPVWIGLRYINGSMTNSSSWYWVNQAHEPVQVFNWSLKGIVNVNSLYTCSRYTPSGSLNNYDCLNSLNNYACEFAPIL